MKVVPAAPGTAKQRSFLMRGLGLTFEQVDRKGVHGPRCGWGGLGLNFEQRRGVVESEGCGSHFQISSSLSVWRGRGSFAPRLKISFGDLGDTSGHRQKKFQKKAKYPGESPTYESYPRRVRIRAVTCSVRS